MKSFSEVISKQFPPSLMARMTEFDRRIDHHPAVQELKSMYPEKFNQENDRGNFSRLDLHHYIDSQDTCLRCTGLEKCPSLLKGHQMVVKDGFSGPGFVYSPCDLMIGHENQVKVKRLIKSHHVPDHILQTSFKDLDKDATRIQAIKGALRFCATFEKGKTKRGLYLYGPMGVGKSAIAGAMTQDLAKRGHDVIMVYVPDFLAEVKDAIKTGEVEDKLDAMRQVSVLILDDIGAEQLTPWTRDEVLGPILQRRMEKLPTVFTSNLTLDELRNHLKNAKTKADYHPDPKKAERLMERIEPFVDVYQVFGPNRRRQQS